MVRQVVAPLLGGRGSACIAVPGSPLQRGAVIAVKSQLAQPMFSCSPASSSTPCRKMSTEVSANIGNFDRRRCRKKSEDETPAGAVVGGNNAAGCREPACGGGGRFPRDGAAREKRWEAGVGDDTDRLECFLEEDEEDVGDDGTHEEVDEEVHDNELHDVQPGAAETAATANRLRMSASECLATALQKLRAEFEVQLLIWKSIYSIGVKGTFVSVLDVEDGSVSILRAMIEDFLMVATAGPLDPMNVTPALEAIILKNKEVGSLFSNAMVSGMHHTIHADQTAKKQQELADVIEETGGLNGLPATLMSKYKAEELDALVEACQLSDHGLAYRARQILGRPFLGQTENNISTSCFETSDNCCSDGSTGGVSPASVGRHRRESIEQGCLLSNGARSAMSARSATLAWHKGTPAQGIESGTLGCPGMPDVAPWISAANLGIDAEVAAASYAVRERLAVDLGSAWGKLYQEFTVQVLVWKSIPVQDSTGKWCTALAIEDGPHTALKETLEAALEGAVEHPAAAAKTLVAILQRDSDEGLILSFAMRAQVKVVIDTEAISQKRRDLKETLDIVGRTGNVLADGMRESDLEDTIVGCRLGDLGLEYRVRRVLGLSVGDMRARWKQCRHEKRNVGPREDYSTLFDFSRAYRL